MIGAGVGGLSAAIHARLLGFDVQVIEKQAHVGGKAAGFESNGYRFDPGPSIIILPQIYEAVFRAAGRQMSDYLVFDRLDPITRVFFRDQVLDLSSDIVTCVEQIASIEPAAKQFVSNLVHEFDRIRNAIDEAVFEGPITGWASLIKPSFLKIGTSLMAKRTYRQHIDESMKSPLLRAFFYGFPSYSGLDYNTKTLSPLLIPYYMLRDGVFYPRGGVSAIPQALERLALELGVKFTFNAQVNKLTTLDGQTLIATDCGDFFANSVISNVDRITCQTWLDRPVHAIPSYSYFTIQWGIKCQYDNLEHHTLIVPDEPFEAFDSMYRLNEFPDSPVIYLNATSKTDLSVAPDGATNLFVVVSSPSQVPSCDWNQMTDQAKGKTIGQLKKFGFAPQSEEIEFERIQTPLTFETRDGNYKGSLYGPIEKQRFLGGMFPLSNQDEKDRNLFYCGGSVQPGAGLPMVTLSGKFAAQLAARSQNLL